MGQTRIQVDSTELGFTCAHHASTLKACHDCSRSGMSLTRSTGNSKHARPWKDCLYRTTLLREIERWAEQPTIAELKERLARRSPVVVSVPPAEIIRGEREGR